MCNAEEIRCQTNFTAWLDPVAEWFLQNGANSQLELLIHMPLVFLCCSWISSALVIDIERNATVDFDDKRDYYRDVCCNITLTVENDL